MASPRPIVEITPQSVPTHWWYGEPNAISNAIGYAKFRNRSHDAVICVYDDADKLIETHEHAGEFKEAVRALFALGHSS